MSSAEVFLLAPDDAQARSAADALFAAIGVELAALMPCAADIRHIGSTAVPGCLTKGDLDIAVRVGERDFAAAEKVLERRFARNLGSDRSAYFAAFEDCDATPHLGIQLVVIGSACDDFHPFTAALRADPALVAEYNRLKQAWHGKPMDDYRRAKDAFITRILDRTG
jgi:GrpB-like predicted nucleotidyltransferase (UPF0157 family)